MKRSLFIAIVVLLMAALFVSCNADKAVEDQLVEVTIGGGARAIEASATLDVDTENLYWFYTAKKLGGIFKKGEKLNLTSVKTANEVPAKGLKESSLGQMSTGPWEFSFYGFNNAEDVSDLTKAVYQQKSLKVQINAAISLAVTLERGTGALPPARVGFAAAGLTWMIDGVGTNLTLNMTIYEGDDAFLDGPVVGTYSTDLQKYVFIPGTETVVVDDGPHDYTVRVYNSYNNPVTGTNDSELVGETVLTIIAQSGMVYIIGDVSGTTGITAVTPQPVDVEIGVPTKPLEATAVVAASAAAQTISTNVSPAGAATGATQVTFPANSFAAGDTDMKLDVVTYSTEAAAAKFTVVDGSAVVAGIDFTLSAGDQTITQFNGKEATITTFITKNLNESDVHVYYAGDTNTNPTDYKVSYESSTGKLVFKTTHFSEYYVISKSVAIIGERAYATLEAAFAAVQNGETIVLTDNVDLNKTVRSTKNNVVLDLNGKTISNTEDIWAGNDWSLISVDGGSLTIKGNGKLLAKENDCFAIDVCDNGTLVIEDGTFVGNISAVYAYEGDVIINGGTFSISQLSDYNDYRYLLNLFDENGRAGTATITVTGGSFYKFNPANNLAEGPDTNFVAEGYVAVADGDYWKVADAVAKIGGEYYQSLAAAVAAVPNDGTETTITLLKSTEGTGIGLFNTKVPVATNKNIIIDLGGFTYTVNGGTVGSTGTESQAWHLEKGNKVVIKNGALRASCASAQMLIQNYCDLTLEDVDLDNSDNSRITYVVSNNFGSLTVKGSTVIKSHSSRVAFDVWYGMAAVYDDGITILFDDDFTGEVNGKVEFGADSRVTAATFEEAVNNGKVGITVEDNIGIFNVTTVKGSSFEFAYEAEWERADANPFVW